VRTGCIVRVKSISYETSRYAVFSSFPPLSPQVSVLRHPPPVFRLIPRPGNEVVKGSAENFAVAFRI
jgi:hypothetical protein